MFDATSMAMVTNYQSKGLVKVKAEITIREAVAIEERGSNFGASGGYNTNSNGNFNNSNFSSP